MPAAYPPEFKRRAVELGRQGDKPIAELAKELGNSESGLRRWMAQADVDERHRPSLASDEHKELAALRRRSHVLRMENEIRRWAAAYVARENVLSK